MTKIKFCGLRRDEDILAVNRVLPDFAGFILSPRFERYVPPEILVKLTSGLDKNIKRVGVFVDNPEEDVLKSLKSGVIDIAQLHGNESDEYILQIMLKSKKPVIKAFRIECAEDIERARRCPADYVLLDAGTGTGKRFDWSLISDIGRDFFLAGGINPENVQEAVKKFQPYAVDVSSGIETDKFKDINKMKALADAVRRAKVQ